MLRNNFNKSIKLIVISWFIGFLGTLHAGSFEDYFKAVVHDDESAVIALTLRGFDLNTRKAEVNKPGWTPLHYAASNATTVSVDMVRLLLEHHAYIDAESPNRSTPLMMAAHYGSTDVVQLLLEEGADPMIRNEQGMTAIDFARRAQRDAHASLIASFVRARQPKGRW